jgi:hypothetical protein
MISLLSIHIPKTAGTSFYNVLQAVYGSALSPSLRRKDISTLLMEAGKQGIPHALDAFSIWHGHFRYLEVKGWHVQTAAPVITWLRHPIDRIHSNYLFFQSRLQNPEINPEVYALNKHRLGESLLDYAALPENQNRISWFLEGITPEEFLFIGIMEQFDIDLQRLGHLLKWPRVPPADRLNISEIAKQSLSSQTVALLEKWNEKDLEWYHNAKTLFAD